MTSARSGLTALLPALAALGLACSGAPSVRIDSPADSAALTAADDLDLSIAGVQIAVDATTGAADGSPATAYAGGELARATVFKGHVHFPRVTVRDGAAALTVSVVDNGKAGLARVRLTADSFGKGCRILAPATGSTVTADSGDSGLVNVSVQVFCRGLALNQDVQLSLDSAPVPLSAKLDAGGLATFHADLLPGLNQLLVFSKNAEPQLALVTLASPRCRVTLSPPSGTLFNAAGGRHLTVADANPAEPGEQAHLVVQSACNASPVRLVIGGQTFTSAIQNGQASFDVTLPEGQITAQAFVGVPGQGGASRLAAWTVDSVVPSALLAQPAAGALLVDGAGAPDVTFAGNVGPLGAGGVAVLEIDEGLGAGGSDLLLAPDASGNFQVAQTLQNGPHVARLIGQRASGNVTQGASVAFAVFFEGGQVSLLVPAEGAQLNLTSLAPSADGASASFQLHTAKLVGGTASVSCGATSGTAAPIPASGDLTVTVDLPLGSCAATSFTCTASAQLNGPGAPVFSTGPVHFTADATAPTASLTSPPATGNTGSATVDVHATTSCAAESQSFRLLVNGAQAAAGTVAGNAVDVLAVALAPGDNQLVLQVSDASGNQGSATAVVTRFTGAPALALTAPAAGATLGVADDVDQDLSNGLQARVTVQLDNRPAGSSVSLTIASVEAGGAPGVALAAQTQIIGAHRVATFAAVTLPEGTVQLRACATDAVPSPPPPTCVSEQVTVSTGRALCNVIFPADGAVLSASQDSRPDVAGFQTSVRVQTSGDGGVTATLTAPDGSQQSFAPQAPSGGGLQTVTFADLTLPADGAYKFDALCASSTLSRGRAVTSNATLSTQGPAVAFTAPTSAQVFNAASTDTSPAQGFQIDVQVKVAAAGVGGTATLSVDCGGGPTATGPLSVPAGGAVAFVGVKLLNPDGGEAVCTLTAAATDSNGTQGLPDQISVTVDRSTPAPVFSSPQDGAVYGPAAPELDCSTPSTTVLRAATISLSDTVLASGLTLFVNGVQANVTATPGSGTWSFGPVVLKPGSNTLVAIAVDAAGNSGPSSATFYARCQGAQTSLSLITTGNKLGYAQDKDHATAGEQIAVSVGASSADGTALRVCSTVGGNQAQPCAGSGSFALPLPQPAPTLQGGAAAFDLTLQDGPQTLTAEVIDPSVAPSAAQAVIVRSMPPLVTALSIAENDSDSSLNQAELAQTPLHFLVQASGAVGGQIVEIHSTTLAAATVLGSATLPVSGSVSVPVPASALLGSGGPQQFVFYVLLHDDAGNPDSIPGSEYPADPAVTLGTQASPFIVAPNPTVSLDRPSAATTKLLAADDKRCAGGGCPGTAPLSYQLASSTSAPDGSRCAFLLDGAQVGTDITLSGGACTAPELLGNGAARVLAVRITDLYGNVVTTAGRTVLIDSVPPALTIVAPAVEPLVSPQTTLTVQTGATLEAGQLITVLSDVDGQVGSASATGSSTNVTVQLTHNGTHHLTATAQDAAGNPGTSPSITVNQQFVGPAVQLSVPAPQASAISFGTSTQSGGRCAPALQTSTSNAPDGTSVTLFVTTSTDCTVMPTAGFKTATVANNAATFTNVMTFANGGAGFLCAQVTVNAITSSSTAQQFVCDLTPPVLSFTAPASNQLYVAPPLNGRTAIASQGTDPNTLQADFTLGATAKKGSVVTLTLDGASTAFATSQPLAADCNTPCAVSLAGASVAVAPGTLSHVVHALVTEPNGNSSTATVGIQVAIAPPVDALPAFTVTHRLAGIVHVDLASVPGDRGTGGTASSFDVRWSTAGALTGANWFASSSFPFSAAELPAPLAAGAHQTFDLLLPTDQATLFVGVRAVDSQGNLGAVSALPSVATQLSRTPAAGVSIPNGSGNFVSRLRVADLDGDGFDDIVVAYPGDSCAGLTGNGCIYVYFGSANGIANPTAPMVLAGQIGSGLMGSGQSVDVGDFDGDGKTDLVAAATDCASVAQVYLWKGSAIAAAKASNLAPAPVILSDGTNLIGGTVRAVGHVSGGTAGVDLLLSKYTAFCGTAPTLTAGILPGVSTAAPGWTSGTGTAFSTSGLISVTLPAGHPNGSLEAAALDVLETGTTHESLFLAFLEVDPMNLPAAFTALYTLKGSNLVAGAPVALTSGNPLPKPLVPTATSPFLGAFVGGGRDATGDGKKDLVISDQNTKQVFLYDSTTLIAGAPQPALFLDTNQDNNGDVGYCAELLPDLDGDGIAEFTGCANLTLAPNVYLGFGGSGPSPTFFAHTSWNFTPHRAQRISGAAAFGRKVSAGHVSSLSAIDLVVLSESGSGADTLTLLR